MTDFLLVGLLIVAVAAALAICSGGLAPWARGEWRWARARTAAEAQEAAAAAEPFTADHPRVAATLARMRYARTKMERHGIKPLVRLEGDPRARDVRKGWQRIAPMGEEPAPANTNVRTFTRRSR